MLDRSGVHHPSAAFAEFLAGGETLIGSVF